jgi:hypothetical protein
MKYHEFKKSQKIILLSFRPGLGSGMTATRLCRISEKRLISARHAGLDPASRRTESRDGFIVD